MGYEAKKLSEKQWIGRSQHPQYESLWEIRDGDRRHPLRVSIHVDQYYWHQSRVRLHRYDGEKWRFIASRPETEIEEVYDNLPGNIYTPKAESFKPEVGHYEMEKRLLQEFRLIGGI